MDHVHCQCTQDKSDFHGVPDYLRKKYRKPLCWQYSEFHGRLVIYCSSTVEHLLSSLRFSHTKRKKKTIFSDVFPVI